jgi:hypothetical protein
MKRGKNESSLFLDYCFYDLYIQDLNYETKTVARPEFIV